MTPKQKIAVIVFVLALIFGTMLFNSPLTNKAPEDAPLSAVTQAWE